MYVNYSFFFFFYECLDGDFVKMFIIFFYIKFCIVCKLFLRNFVKNLFSIILKIIISRRKLLKRSRFILALYEKKESWNKNNSKKIKMFSTIRLHH